MKRCAICEKLKPCDSFSGRGSYCKPCQNAFNKKWRIENDAHVKERKRQKWAQVTPREKWDRHLQVRYGITADFYEALAAAQGNVCAICAQLSRRKRLSVDHCHRSGAVRGLLCERCNSVLGRVDDDRSILLGAADYLVRSRVPLQVVGGAK